MPVKFVRTAIAALVRRLDAGRPARMPRQFRMQWNSGRLSRALKIPEEQILGYFRDGAHAPFLVGGRLVQEHPGWGPGAGPGRLVAPDGGAWEVRCLTEGGVSLAGDTHRNPGRGIRKKLPARRADPRRYREFSNRGNLCAAG